VSNSLAITTTVGPRNATTDPETGLRFYLWKGTKYPSSTSMRRMAGLPFMLHQWTLSKVIERAVSEFPLMTAMMNRPPRPRERVRDKNIAKEVGRWLRSASTEERDSAAELGTAVHDAAVNMLPIVAVDADVQPFLRQFYDWLAKSRATILTTERQVWNLTVGYAGTFDLLVRFPNGDIAVVDIKTGRGTYPDHVLQLISYALAEFVGEDDIVDQPMTDLLHQANTMALLHLREDGWTWQVVTASTEAFTAFRGLADFAKWANLHQTITDLIERERSGAAS
jgi:hypothetical protein